MRDYDQPMTTSPATPLRRSINTYMLITAIMSLLMGMTAAPMASHPAMTVVHIAMLTVPMVALVVLALLHIVTPARSAAPPLPELPCVGSSLVASEALSFTGGFGSPQGVGARERSSLARSLDPGGSSREVMMTPASAEAHTRP